MSSPSNRVTACGATQTNTYTSRHPVREERKKKRKKKKTRNKIFEEGGGVKWTREVQIRMEKKSSQWTKHAWLYSTLLRAFSEGTSFDSSVPLTALFLNRRPYFCISITHVLVDLML